MTNGTRTVVPADHVVARIVDKHIGPNAEAVADITDAGGIAVVIGAALAEASANLRARSRACRRPGSRGRELHAFRDGWLVVASATKTPNERASATAILEEVLPRLPK